MDDDDEEIDEVTEEPETDENFPAFAADETEGDEDVCSLDKDPGPCKGYSQRWYYDKDAESCTQVHSLLQLIKGKTSCLQLWFPFQFSYFGCLGNKNNFASREQCEARCGGGESDVASYSWGGEDSGAALTAGTDDGTHANIKWVEGVNDWNELDRFR